MGTERLSGQWKGNEYHILHQNCLDFANHFCRELGVREIPGWVDRIPLLASTIATPFDAAAEGVEQAAELAMTTAADVEDTVLAALPDDEMVGQMAEDLSKKAEAVAAKVLGEDLASKANFTSSLWKAARSVTRELQQATGVLVEDPAPPSTHDNKEEKEADRVLFHGEGAIEDSLGLPTVSSDLAASVAVSVQE